MRTYGRVRDEFVVGPPAGTVVQVGALAVPGMMLEVEATAVIGGRKEQPYEVADVEAPASPSPP